MGRESLTPDRVFGQEIIEERIKAATRVRKEIIEAGDEVPFLLKEQKLALADEGLKLVRFAGNLVIAAFFAANNDKTRKLKRDELLHQFTSIYTKNMTLRPTRQSRIYTLATRRFTRFIGDRLSEVFGRENGGFDAIAGNPPFMWGNRVSSLLGDRYRDWLLAMHAKSHGNSDLVAHFFEGLSYCSTKLVASGF